MLRWTMLSTSAKCFWAQLEPAKEWTRYCLLEHLLMLLVRFEPS